MLGDDIRKSIRQLKQLDILESAVRNEELKLKNDNEFSNIVNDFSLSMTKLSFASNELEFTVTGKMLKNLDEVTERLENVISAGVVNEEELVVAKRNVTRKITPGLAKEWKAFHEGRTSGVYGKLTTIGSLISDKEKISSIRTNITNGSEWTDLLVKDNGINTRLQLLKNGISEVEEIEESLDLSDEVKEFVISVTQGKAKVTDISDTIIEWIKNENLEGRFVIKFRN
ncbi:hypothetical protein SH2C18_19940 [Clostridium sediminicola]|uniref:hypothetical protein n=1 Tax=Clostridium sediminicola TaxID=3114879 RepID=UPI0031F24ACA